MCARPLFASTSEAVPPRSGPLSDPQLQSRAEVDSAIRCAPSSAAAPGAMKTYEAAGEIGSSDLPVAFESTLRSCLASILFGDAKSPSPTALQPVAR